MSTRPPEAHTSTTLAALGDLDIDLAAVKGKVRIAIDGATPIKVGDIYRLKVDSDVSGRLVLIDVDAAGRVTQIFPNKFTASPALAKIEAGKLLSIPSPGWELSGFRADLPAGDGRLIAIITPNEVQPPTVKAESSEQMTRGFTPVTNTTSYAMNVVQQITTLAQRAQSTEKFDRSWAFNDLKYTIVAASSPSAPVTSEKPGSDRRETVRTPPNPLPGEATTHKNKTDDNKECDPICDENEICTKELFCIPRGEGRSLN